MADLGGGYEGGIRDVGESPVRWIDTLFQSGESFVLIYRFGCLAFIYIYVFYS